MSFADTTGNSNNNNNNSSYPSLYQFTPQQQRQIHFATNQLIIDHPPVPEQQHQQQQQHQSLSYVTAQNQHSQEKIYNTTNNLPYHYDVLPLPTTFEDAIRPCKNRAIIITETTKPYRVVDVNRCWMELCGYTYVEAVGKTIGSLLHGPRTNSQAATTLIHHLLHGENDVGTILVNYKKDGTPFVNRIRVGPIYNPTISTTQPTHFVGVLQQLSLLSE
jgi:PAS domain S-box-containing protein